MVECIIFDAPSIVLKLATNEKSSPSKEINSSEYNFTTSTIVAGGSTSSSSGGGGGGRGGNKTKNLRGTRRRLQADLHFCNQYVVDPHHAIGGLYASTGPVYRDAFFQPRLHHETG